MRISCLFLLLLTFANARSQDWIDLANVYWRTSPNSTFDNIDDYRRNLNMFVLNAKAPIVLGDKNVLLFGIEYQYNDMSSNTQLYKDYAFTSSMLQIGWEHKWNEKSKMLFMAIPRFQTDYNDVGLDHFQIGGLALGTTSRSEKFDWRYGLYFNAEFFGPMFVPLFGFNWQIDAHQRLKMMIPLSLKYSYRPSDKFGVGLQFEGVNASYRYQQIQGENWSNSYLDKADNNAWIFSEWHLGANTWFHLKAGHSVLRKYRFFSPDDAMTLKLGPVNIGDNRNFNDPKAVPVQLRDGWSFEARFIYRLPLPKD